jgi:hypothetical protein
MNTEVGYLPSGSVLLLYYAIVSVIGVLFFVYIRKDKLSVLIFLIFFVGVSDYWGEIVNTLFKFLILTLAILIYFDIKEKLYIKITPLIIFFLFSLAFWISIFSNQNPFLYSFSQFTKFLIPFILFMFLLNNTLNIQESEHYLGLIIKLILLQVLFSFIKLITIGFSESIVGSVAYLGGNSATILPILGYIIIHFLSDGKLKKLEIIQIASMLFISIMSFKRMIWFLFPIVILVLNSNLLSVKYIKYAILLLPFILYLGVRLNPTLNKEKKIWGSFDLAYALNYAQDYYGVENMESRNDKSFGRLAGNNYMMNFIAGNLNNYKIWFGYGPKTIYGIAYEEYARTNWPWGVTSKGSLTGAARFFIAYGLLGICLYLCLMIYFFCYTNNKKFKIFIIFFFLFEFFFYLDSFIYLPIIISILLLLNYLTLRQKISFSNFYLKNLRF